MNVMLEAIKSLFRKIDTNRTHYDERVSERVVITFDGNIEGKETLAPDDEIVFVKVVDTVWPIKNCNKFIVGFTGTMEETAVPEIQRPVSTVYTVDQDIYVVTEDTDGPMGHLTKGVWFTAWRDIATGDIMEYMSRLEFTVTTGELKKLDDKFMPDSVYKAIDERMAIENPTFCGCLTNNYGYGNAVDTSIAIGYESQADPISSFAIGRFAKATGLFSYAIGDEAESTDISACVLGNANMSVGEYSLVCGKYNMFDTPVDYAIVVGNGKYGARSNAHTLDWNGNATFAGTVNGTGADYAEYFEWIDGNPNDEDRIGLIVTLDGEKIRLANPDDEILGVVTGTAMVLGDNAEWEWRQKYIVDDYGRAITEMVEEFIEVPNAETGEMKKVSTGFFPHRKLNPDFDPEQKYVRRCDRPEWESIGMLGKIHVTDDGTCVVGGYAAVGENGIATASTEKTCMRVMKRITDSVILVLMK